LAVAVFGLLAVALPASAGAFVYWTHNNSPSLIGRANLDGSAPNQSLISGESYFAPGVASDGSHLYWTDNGKIGRANLDGTGVNPDFVPGATAIRGIAVDGAHIYWSSGNCVGRAKLDGSEPDNCFVPASEGTDGVAVGGGFIFWTNRQFKEIGRATINGGAIKEPFLESSELLSGIAASETGIYFDNGNKGIATSNFAGTVVAPSWIPGALGDAVAVDGTYIYWADGGIGRVGRDQSGFDASFVPPSGVYGVAVDSGGGGAVQPPPTGGGNQPNPPPATPPGPPPPPGNFRFGALKLNKKSGGATLTIVLPGPGKLVLKGKGIVNLTTTVRAKGRFAVAIKPTKKTTQTLQMNGKAGVTAKITFTPTGGTPHTESKSLTLKS
jgi:hypothetical protein